jgi:mono/diheme cytochrome c family protein
MTRETKIAIGVVAAIVVIAIIYMIVILHGGAKGERMIAARAPIGDLIRPIADTTPNAAQLRRGQYLVLAGDCASCHTQPNGIPFAGGYALHSPFGVIYTENLTSDRDTGIGAWTPDQFYNAIHNGIGAQGEHLYPGLPYTYFTHITRADSDDMLAFLKTLPPVHYTQPRNELPFPLNIRLANMGWNMLFFTPGEFKPDPSKSAEWNRGAYLVTGAGHCGACHTPKNFLAGDRTSKAYQGGDLSNWVAPDLTANPRTGLGKWSEDDIVEYLKTGRNARANAGGTMADVVTNSTSRLTDADLHAIATYLKDLPASRETTSAVPDGGAMKRGAAVFSDACSSCHMAGGGGQPRFFPPLRDNVVVQQHDPTSLIRMVLAGDRTAPTPTRPTPLTMPSFAWKLDDHQIADVLTYIRNSWGNNAATVSTSQVQALRKTLDLKTSRLTDNSTDR